MKKIIILTTILLTMSITALAQRTKHSTPSPSYSSYSFSSSDPYEASITMTQGKLTSQGSNSNTTIAGELYYQFWPKIQIGGSLSSQSINGKSTTEYAIVGVYNFNENLQESIFAYGGLGSADSQTGFIMGGGKRFPVWNKVYWTPKIAIAKYGSADMSFILIPLNVTLFFNL